VRLLESEALVVRTVEYGESDVVATLVTEQFGKLGVVVRGGRKASRRVGGALEPVHTVSVAFEDKGQELSTLKEARIVRLRDNVVSNLEALDAAGVALRWARHLFPPRAHEPEGWRVLIHLLDGLDAGGAETGSPSAKLAHAGIAMLAAVGYGLDFARCVVCRRPCPEQKAACVDPARGGLVCRSCGGAASVLAPDVRQAAFALASGQTGAHDEECAQAVLRIVDRAMAVHAGFER